MFFLPLKKSNSISDIKHTGLPPDFSISFTGDQSYTGYKIFLYAKNYNVLRIMEGMGGLLYAN